MSTMGVLIVSREKGPESLFNKIMAENNANLRKNKDIENHKAQRTPHNINTKKPTLKHIII